MLGKDRIDLMQHSGRRTPTSSPPGDATEHRWRTPAFRIDHPAGPDGQSSRALALRRWSEYWSSAAAPAWASRDAFIAAAAVDPFLTVPVWLSATERQAAWVAVESLLPTRRVHYLVHRHWDEWWLLWRSTAPRLGTYSVSILVDWLVDAVDSGRPANVRAWFHRGSAVARELVPGTPAVAPHGAHPSAGHRQPGLVAAHPPLDRSGAPGGPLGAWLLALGTAVLVLGALQATGSQAAAVSAPRYAIMGFGLLMTALAWVHAHTPGVSADDAPGGSMRRVWPLILAMVLWIPLLHALFLRT